MKKYLLFIGVIWGLTCCNQEDDTYHYEEYNNNYKTDLIYKKGREDLKDSIIISSPSFQNGVKEMVNALKFIDKSGNDYLLFGVSNEAALSDINAAGKYPCKWWKIGCHLKEIFDISIKDILEIILG